ncbi:MAG: phytanoyl-CoA dioxygenase family protein [Chloroflexota bacterium]|jgi:ectoine hydroxylase-related dioxygenase (phytanoyl-CoA dioxygenase family)|nr:phytanoyl-CoA dioxygenase family protein [Chloroflexota bacterium]|tara:strand:- start:406 stop:1173 length:768 start_codon:yes stop_codon:yes gene_type:complete
MTIDWQNAPERIISDLKKDGFVVFPNFLERTEVTEILVNIERFIAEVIPSLPRDQVFYEDLASKDSLKQIQKMQTHDSYFKNLFNNKFKRLAEVLLEGPVVGQNMQYFNKPTKIGKPTPPHQDGYYFMLTPCEALTMWLALDEVDEENGCVRYVRGSNHLTMRSHSRTKTLGFSQGITDYGTDDLANEVALVAKPGDLLVHLAMTIHRADGNQSESRNRRAIGFIYYSHRAKIDTKAHAAYQKKLSEEMVEAKKI